VPCKQLLVIAKHDDLRSSNTSIGQLLPHLSALLLQVCELCCQHCHLLFGQVQLRLQLLNG
jgi:hypothetical protein